MTIDTLRSILNYDTNVRRILEWDQRCILHHQISRLMNGLGTHFPEPEFEYRTHTLSAQLLQMRYRDVRTRYTQDRKLEHHQQPIL